ncbi:hypothetical protein [Litoribacillus peritrichatus]|uniref:hypothetical protein n=1 Tax=Litoribacillus peritrichatus TaxID=718191 RepID=UPI0031D68751
MRFVLLLMIFFCGVATAEVETFVRDYTYNASENDSKVSARKAAMQQLQSLLIQEVGVQVRSTFEVDDTVSNDVLTREVKANYGTFARAFTQTKILDERWNGETFYIKAEVIVDTDNLIETIQQVYVQQVNVPAKTTVCEDTREKVKKLLYNAHRRESVAEAIELAMNNPIDEDCHDWQFMIIHNFKSLGVHDDDYRQFLFEQIKQEKSSLIDRLLVDVLNYAIRVNRLSDDEWQVVTETLALTHSGVVNSVIATLINGTQVLDDHKYSESSKKSNAQKQTHDALKAQLDELLHLTGQNKIGLDEPATVSQVSSSILPRLMSYQPELVPDYYERLSRQINRAGLQRLSNSVTNYYKKQPDEERLNVVKSYFNQVVINQAVSNSLYGLFQRLERERKSPELSMAALKSIINSNKDQAALVMELARTNDKTRNLWSIRFDLPNSSACSLKECAAMLFDLDKRTQQTGAEFLVAYGERAKPIKNKVIKKLERIRALNKVQEPTHLVSSLLKVLEQIDATDDQSVSLMVWGLGGASKKTQDQARASLTHLGSKALPQMIVEFDQAKQYVQRRMIEVMGTFKTDRAKTDNFLKQVKPANNHIRFAIEDARESLTLPSS